jgi:hypothetical protein
MTTVIINDYVSGNRVILSFGPEDFEALDEHWDKSDVLLAGLQHIDTFRGRSRWCDLLPNHYRLMVAKNLHAAAELEDHQRVDDTNPVVASLNFVTCALIRCLEEGSESQIEFMRINRVGSMDIAIEYDATVKMQVPPARTDQGPTSRIGVVVDNTKDD